MVDFSNLFPDQRDQGKNNLEQCQYVLLRMLRIFDFLCRQEGIEYWLAGGTLLGAVRYGGFIPWDCDIDIALTEQQYARLQDLIPHLPHDIFFQNSQTDPFYRSSNKLMAKLRDRYSNYQEWATYNPDAKWQNGLQIDLLCYIKKGRHYISPFSGVKFRQEIILPLRSLEFESFPFMGPNDPHSFLTRKYGNYQKLPPEYEQVPHEGKAEPMISCDHPESLGTWAPANVSKNHSVIAGQTARYHCKEEKPKAETFESFLVFCGFCLRLTYPEQATKAVRSVVNNSQKPQNLKPAANIHISYSHKISTFCLLSLNSNTKRLATEENFSSVLTSFIVDEFLSSFSKGPLFQASIMEYRNKGILILGKTNKAVDTLTQLLCSCGYRYVANDYCYVDKQKLTLSRPPLPAKLNTPGNEKLTSAFQPDITDKFTGKKQGDILTLSILLLPCYSPEKPFSLDRLSPAQSTLQLMNHLLNATVLGEDCLGITSTIARKVHGAAITYNNSAHCSDIDKLLTRLIADSTLK